MSQSSDTGDTPSLARTSTRSSLLDVPSTHEPPLMRPQNVSYVSSPAYESPLRHHRRKVSTPRQVKETLHATSEYTNSEDDGAAIHRINQYSIGQEVGRGSFGAVHLATDQYGNEFAVKEFSKSRLRKRAQSSILRRPGARTPAGHLAAGGINVPLHRRSASDIHKDEEAGNPLYLIREEIAIMKKLNHPNLVSLLEVLDDPTEDSLYMVLEMCKNGVVMKVGMHDPAEPHDPEKCRTWFRDLILGIEYLHAQGVVHRDIKPDNLLLTEDDVLKIVDFGVSEMFEKDSDFMTTKSAGSPAFLPPELCVPGHGRVSGRAADIWSMGVTLYCLYFGRVPFEKINPLELYESIRTDDADLDRTDEEDIKDLLSKVLEKDPAKRIKMPELREHPWVTRRGTDPLLSSEENTAILVQPPTEEEMKRAITSKLSNLLVVMKAVNRFKSLIAHRRPQILQSILGQPSRLVLPPEPITPYRASLHRSQSLNMDERVPIEQALVREGVHREIDVGKVSKPLVARDDAAVLGFHTDRDLSSKARRGESGNESGPGRTGKEHTDRSRSFDDRAEPSEGSASQEFKFLAIGATSTQYDRTPKGSPPIVSESPPAVEDNVYEMAYHEEVERIRTKNETATLYVTKRVQDTEKYKDDKNMLGIGGGMVMKGFKDLAQKARDAKHRHSNDEDPDDLDDAGLKELIQGGASKTGLKKLGEAVNKDLKNFHQGMQSVGDGNKGTGAIKKLAQATKDDIRTKRDELSSGGRESEDEGSEKQSNSALKDAMQDMKTAYKDKLEPNDGKLYKMPELKKVTEELKDTQQDKTSANSETSKPDEIEEKDMPALQALTTAITANAGSASKTDANDPSHKEVKGSD